MKSIAALSNPEVRRIYLKLKEHKWPTSNFLDNVEGLQIIEMTREEIDKMYQRDDIEKLLRSNIFYLADNETAMRMELIRFAHSKSMFLSPGDYTELVNNDFTFFKYQSILGFERYTTNYFASELFYDEPELYDIYQLSPNHTTVMGAIINAIGIDKFAKMFFTGDYKCFTTEILDRFGKDFTKRLYEFFSIYNADTDDIEDFFYFMNKFAYYLPGDAYFSEVRDKYQKYVDYKEEKIRKLGKNIIPFKDE